MITFWNAQVLPPPDYFFSLNILRANLHLVTLVCSEEFVDIDCFHVFFPENTKKESAKSCPTLVTPRTIARQASLSMGFSRQEYWSGLPFPSPGELPDPGIETRSPTLQADALPTELHAGGGKFQTLMPVLIQYIKL